MINYLLLWLPMIAIAFANAALREILLRKYLAEQAAHQVSTITLILFVSVYAWFVFPFLRIINDRQAVIVGLVWMVLTMAFEFTLGRILKQSWNSLFQQYNIFAGRIWLLFILYLLWLPYLVYAVRS